MLNRNDIENLLRKHHRRLLGLKEKKAEQGISTPVETLNEIKDIEQEIEKLQAELEEITQLAKILSPEQYGIEIRKPTEYEIVGSTFEVNGTYKNLPEGYVIWVSTFEIYQAGDVKKKKYWPQELATFTDTGNEKWWHSKVDNIGGGYKGEMKEYLVIAVGPEGQALFNYFKYAGMQSGQWPPITQLTSDIVECVTGKIRFNP